MSREGTVQLGWRVDEDVKRRFEEYALTTEGETPGYKGRAVEKAMQRYMGEDRLGHVEQTLNQIAESLGVEKKKGKQRPITDGRYHVPEGKNPGDVEKRQQAVIDNILDLADEDRLPTDKKGHIVTQKLITDRIEAVAGITSDKTISNYLEGIVKQGPFRSHPDRPGVWVVNL